MSALLYFPLLVASINGAVTYLLDELHRREVERKALSADAYQRSNLWC